MLSAGSADMLSAVGLGTSCPLVFGGQGVRQPAARSMHALQKSFFMILLAEKLRMD